MTSRDDAIALWQAQAERCRDERRPDLEQICRDEIAKLEASEMEAEPCPT